MARRPLSVVANSSGVRAVVMVIFRCHVYKAHRSCAGQLLASLSRALGESGRKIILS